MLHALFCFVLTYFIFFWRTPCTIFAAQRYASAVYAMDLCLSVWPSIRHKSEFYQKGKHSIIETGGNNAAF